MAMFYYNWIQLQIVQNFCFAGSRQVMALAVVVTLPSFTWHLFLFWWLNWGLQPKKLPGIFMPRNITPPWMFWLSFRTCYFILLTITENEWLFTAISYSSYWVIYAYGVFEFLSSQVFYSYCTDKELQDQRHTVASLRSCQPWAEELRPGTKAIQLST